MSDKDLTLSGSNGLLELAGKVANDQAAQNVFEDYLSRKADNTLIRQRTDLARFADFLTAASVYPAYPDDPTEAKSDQRQRVDRLMHDPSAWSGVSWGLVESFRNWMVDQGDALNSINARLSAIKTYSKLAMKAGYIDPESYTLIKTVNGYSSKEGKRIDDRRDITRRGDKKAQSVKITPKEAKSLKQQPDTPQGRRDTLIMCLLLDHGLRVGELAGLTVGNFDLKSGELRFYRPKVDKTQTHKMTADTLRAVRAWFDSGDVPMMADQPVLRASRKGGGLVVDAGMTERAITNRVKVLGELVGLVGLSAHDCRHFWATKWARKVDPFRLKEAGGWSSMATVDRYIDESEIANEGME